MLLIFTYFSKIMILIIKYIFFSLQLLLCGYQKVFWKKTHNRPYSYPQTIKLSFRANLSAGSLSLSLFSSKTSYQNLTFSNDLFTSKSTLFQTRYAFNLRTLTTTYHLHCIRNFDCIQLSLLNRWLSFLTDRRWRRLLPVVLLSLWDKLWCSSFTQVHLGLDVT